MTKFNKANFNLHGGYLTYRDEFSGKSRFVARFKYGRSGAGTFKTFLIKNFTVEEYFARLEKLEAPLTILESKGYLLPHIRKWLKDGTLSGDRAKHWLEIAARAA